ncbi:hypothetical protein BSAF29S_05294 [Bacillus safensis subsp. safensis]
MVNHKESITSYQASAIIANTTLGGKYDDSAQSNGTGCNYT